jgi:hypothetical protein
MVLLKLMAEEFMWGLLMGTLWWEKRGLGYYEALSLPPWAFFISSSTISWLLLSHFTKRV